MAPEPADIARGRGSLRIVETFGPTLQGEGPSVGRAAQFLRLAGCNLNCVWCDTRFSWDPEQMDPDRPPRNVAIDELLLRLDSRAINADCAPPTVRRLVITGGEPLLQAEPLVGLCSALRQLGWYLEVETSGTVRPGGLLEVVDQFNVSPKLAHSGVAERARLRWSSLEQYAATEKAVFKFVARTVGDIVEIDALLDRIQPTIPSERVMVMPEGTTAEDVLERGRALVNEVTRRGWGLTPRWHTLLWGEERGR